MIGYTFYLSDTLHFPIEHVIRLFGKNFSAATHLKIQMLL